MGLPARVVLYNTWGYNSPRGYAFSFSGKDAFLRAKKRKGGVKNLLLLGDENADKLGGLTLRGRVVFQEADNQKSNYRALAGAAYFDELPSPFGDNTKGLQYSLSEAGTVGAFQSNSILIEENKPWAIRTRIYKVGHPMPVRTFHPAESRFQVSVIKGKFVLQWLSGEWTTALEDEYYAMLADTDIDDADQAAIDTRRALLYADEKTLDIKGEAYQLEHTLIFFPEPCGAVTVFDGELQFLGRFVHPTIPGTRRNGILWPDCTLYVSTNGPALDWQFGRWESNRSGQLRLGEYQPQAPDEYPDFDYTLLKYAPAGTTCGMDNEDLPSSTREEVVVNFATTDTSVAPIFYMGYAVRNPGDRSQILAGVTFDTDDFANNPIMEITPRYESCFRRVALDVLFRNISGQTSQEVAVSLTGGAQFHYPAMENMVADVWVDGTRLICKGIVVGSAHTNIHQATDNLTHGEVFHNDSQIQPRICDQWQILDERVLEEILPVGDNKYFGTYLRECLAICGIPASALTGVGASEGRRLPSAIAGEDWAVQPSKGTTMGDWIRHLLEIYGMGRELWIDGDGIWQFAVRSTTPVHTFSLASGANRPFRNLDLLRDSSESYNVFRVEGADGPDGLPLVATWDVGKGYRPSGGTGSLHYIGRPKAFPTRRDSGLRTKSDCDYAVRSLMLLNCKVGRFVRFDAWWKANIYPGDYVTFEGNLLQIDRIESGSIAYGSSKDTDDYRGRMSLVGREVEAP